MVQAVVVYARYEHQCGAQIDGILRRSATATRTFTS